MSQGTRLTPRHPRRLCHHLTSSARRLFHPADDDLRHPRRRECPRGSSSCPCSSTWLEGVLRRHAGAPPPDRPRSGPQSPPRSDSSPRSCCTSSATRWPRAARASRSSGIDLFFFGGVMKMSSEHALAGAGVPRRGRRPARDVPDHRRRGARQHGRCSDGTRSSTWPEAAEHRRGERRSTSLG